MLNKQRLLTPGPTQIPQEVRAALSMQMIHHRKRPFQEIMRSLQKDLQDLFGTEQPVMPLACSGTGAMQAAASNLFSQGEKVLVCEAGKFGQRWRAIADRRGLQATSLCYEWGEAVRAENVENHLSANPDTAGVLIQASETSTGVLHPIREIAGITRRKNVLLVVDGISAVGISPCPMDEWGIDCLITGSQKGLMLPPGLALISLSSRSWERAEKVEPDTFYFDLHQERGKIQQGQTQFTTPVNLIFGLEAALDLFKRTGLAQLQRKQWALTQLTRSGVRAMGLQPLVPEHYTWGLTSLLVPDGVDGAALLDSMVEEYNVYMAGGQEHFKGRMVRIGHMGDVDWADLLAGLYALGETLARQMEGIPASRDFLEQAMTAYRQAWENPVL